MKSVKKSILLVICALALVTASVFGTLAYLTDTAEVVNTFTVGNVSIELDETKVTPDGTPVTPEERTKEGNEYHLIPGKSYTKDPTMTVVAGSEPAYVRMLVKVSDFADVKTLIEKYLNTTEITDVYAELNKWLTMDNTASWELYINGCGVENDVATLEFRYKEMVDASDATEDIKLSPLFTEFRVPEYVLADDLATLAPANDTDPGFTITVIGEAMQASGFDTDADGAWSEFDAQGAKATESTPAPVATASATVAPTNSPNT